MWQTKYASAVPKNLGLGLNFRPCSEGYFLSGYLQSVVVQQKTKKSENLGRCGRQNMLRLYLKVWEWELIFGCAVKANSSLGIRTLLISIGKLKPTIGMITYRNTCALDSKGKITYKLI